MTYLLIFSIITMISALAFYSVGVWSERFAGRLMVWHLVLFWIGFVFDTTGTTIMGEIAGGLKFNLHGITGILAIILMLCHAIWATIVLKKKQEKAIKNFHKFSTIVWVIWLIPFLSGLIDAML